jgi:hypothetical protein
VNEFLRAASVSGLTSRSQGIASQSRNEGVSDQRRDGKNDDPVPLFSSDAGPIFNDPTREIHPPSQRRSRGTVRGVSCHCSPRTARPIADDPARPNRSPSHRRSRGTVWGGHGRFTSRSPSGVVRQNESRCGSQVRLRPRPGSASIFLLVPGVALRGRVARLAPPV